MHGPKLKKGCVNKLFSLGMCLAISSFIVFFAKLLSNFTLTRWFCVSVSYSGSLLCLLYWLLLSKHLVALDSLYVSFYVWLDLYLYLSSDGWLRVRAGDFSWMENNWLDSLSLTLTPAHTHADTHIKRLALGGPVFVCVLVVRPVI